MPELPLLDAQNYTGKNRGRAQKVAGHHRNSLTAVVGSFNMLGEFDFSDEKLQDTTGVLPPKKQAKIIPENWGPPNR